MRTSQKTPEAISTIGIDVGKNTFHLVGLDKRGAIVLQQKVTRHQLGRRFNLLVLEQLFYWPDALPPQIRKRATRNNADATKT